MGKENGIILYRGPSMIDGSPIVAILTGLASASANSKTGAMLQTWIIRADVNPVEAVKTGGDLAVCGGCQFRPALFKARREAGKLQTGERQCYVNKGQAPAAIYKALHRGLYREVSGLEASALVAGKGLRVGSYGDPCAVPVEIWASLVAVASFTTGYTHRWRTRKAQAYRAFLQASCDTPEDAQDAQEAGWGSFRVALPTMPPLPSEIRCPASKEAGKVTTCADCRMCDGRTGNLVVINAH